MKDNKFTAWVKAHKTELIIAGGAVLTTVGAILLVDNWETVKGMFQKEAKITPSRTINVVTEVPTVPAVESEPILRIIDVREHLRNLPQGHHPSVWKIAEAAGSGIELAENQTIVSAHPRCYAA